MFPASYFGGSFFVGGYWPPGGASTVFAVRIIERSALFVAGAPALGMKSKARSSIDLFQAGQQTGETR